MKPSRGFLAFWITYVIAIGLLGTFAYNMWANGDCRTYSVMHGVSTHYIWYDGCYIDQVEPPRKTNWIRAQHFQPTIPGTSTPDPSLPGYIMQDGTYYQTVPGTTTIDPSLPGFIVEPMTTPSIDTGYPDMQYWFDNSYQK